MRINRAQVLAQMKRKRSLNKCFNLSTLKQQFVVVALTVTLSSPCTYAQDSYSLDAMNCVGGKFGLVLPKNAKKLPLLGKLLDEEVTEVERWEGHIATRKTLHFDGLELGIVQIANEPMRVMITHASVTKPRWNHLVPFKLGSAVNSVKVMLGAAADGDEELKRIYRGETDEVQFETQSGVLSGVSYSCYSG
jgi:hypothetical protein